MSALLFVIFAVAALAAGAAAETGRRGQVCDREVGYTVPAAVQADPALSRRADELVARWCTVAAALAAVPLFGLAATGIGRDELPLAVLAALAVHGWVVVCVGSYPFHRIQQLADDAAAAPAQRAPRVRPGPALASLAVGALAAVPVLLLLTSLPWGARALVALVFGAVLAFTSFGRWQRGGPAPLRRAAVLTAGVVVAAVGALVVGYLV